MQFSPNPFLLTTVFIFIACSGGRRPAPGRADHAAAARDERPVEERGAGHADDAVRLHQHGEREGPAADRGQREHAR